MDTMDVLQGQYVQVCAAILDGERERERIQRALAALYTVRTNIVDAMAEVEEAMEEEGGEHVRS